MSLIIPTAAQLDCLNEFISGALNTWYARLYVTSLTINKTTTLATLLAHEATFSGYSPQHCSTWSAATTETDGSAGSVTTNPQWTPTGSGGTGNLYGYFLTDSAGTKFYGAEAFTGAPVSGPQGVVFEVDVTVTILSRY